MPSVPLPAIRCCCAVCAWRASLQYSELEIARTEQGHDPEELKQALALFDERTAEYGVPTLNERNNHPSEYCKLYMERFLPGTTVNKAAGAKITWNVPPTGRYAEIGETALTDGLYGGTTFVESWIGWEGIDGSFVIDLGEEKSFRRFPPTFSISLGHGFFCRRRWSTAFQTMASTSPISARRCSLRTVTLR